jgi:hypothetical protein
VSRRVSLTELAGKSDMPTTIELPDKASADPKPASVSAPRPSRRRKSAPAKEPVKRVRYDQYERKEARLRADQYEGLTDVSRRLNRTRSGGERITENTLIRVAIDLLLSRRDDLSGATEAELRKSVGL